MKEPEDIVMSWSGGKDSAFALFKLLNQKEYNVKYLLTTIYKPNMRVSMHGVPLSLIEKQSISIGIPLKTIYIEEKSHEEYEVKMKNFLLQAKKEDIQGIAFGDIFLEDLRKYREEKLDEVGMRAFFPLWNQRTEFMAKEFIKNDFKTHICSIDSSKLSKKMIGVDFTEKFLHQLPNDVDHCGERGEFHSFCYNGPIFKERISFQKKGIISKTYEHNNTSHKYFFSDIS